MSMPWRKPGFQFRIPTNFHNTSNKFPKDFYTMKVCKRLEVDFQQISIIWKCPKGWKYHRNLLEVTIISMIWRGHDFSSERREPTNNSTNILHEVRESMARSPWRQGQVLSLLLSASTTVISSEIAIVRTTVLYLHH